MYPLRGHNGVRSCITCLNSSVSPPLRPALGLVRRDGIGPQHSSPKLPGTVYSPTGNASAAGGHRAPAASRRSAGARAGPLLLCGAGATPSVAGACHRPSLGPHPPAKPGALLGHLTAVGVAACLTAMPTHPATSTEAPCQPAVSTFYISLFWAAPGLLRIKGGTGA